MKETIRQLLLKFSTLLPDKSIERSKAEWNSLAEENHRYYIVSKKGKDIDDVQFRTTGEENYRELVHQDELLTQTLAPFSDKRVLDIGCGAGRLLEFFAQDFLCADGVDISERMIEEAKERLVRFDNVQCIAGDGMHYPYDDNTFDLVFSYIVFQHMPSIEVIRENFKDIKRVLKPTGIAKIQIRGGTPVRKGAWFYGPSFTKMQAEELMDEVGLTIIRMGDDTKKRFWLWLKK